MTPITNSQTMEAAKLDCTLKLVVVQSWDELMPDPKSGLIQIEYQTGSDDALDFLKVWATSTIKGGWKLVCEFWMRPLWSHRTGLRFSNDYDSADFARALELLLGHESGFSKLPHREGLIQVGPPTPEERSAAERWARVAFNYQGSSVEQQHAAA